MTRKEFKHKEIIAVLNIEENKQIFNLNFFKEAKKIDGFGWYSKDFNIKDIPNITKTIDKMHNYLARNDHNNIEIPTLATIFSTFLLLIKHKIGVM